MKKVVHYIFLALAFYTCKKGTQSSSIIEYYENGKIKSKTSYSNGRKTVIQYFNNKENNAEAIIRSQGDSMSHVMCYYPNNKLRSIGNFYLDSLKVGKWKYYNNNETLNDINEYLIISGQSYLNQRWVFNEIGDTIGGNFFEVKMKDTINQDEANRFHFFLKKPLFSSNNSESYILLPKDDRKLNKDFSNKDAIEWDTIHSIRTKNTSNQNLKSRHYDILLDTYSEDSGDLSLIGILVEKDLREIDSIDFVTRDIYFDIPYFVKKSS